MMKKNRPQLWDKVWEQPVSSEEDLLTLKTEENSIRWQRIERIVLDQFGTFNNLKVIEIGAGAGTNAALMATRGASVTLLDYSEGAIKRSREFFERNGLSGEFIREDALGLPDVLLNQFDISMSFGLTEHFKGNERIKINAAHFDLLRKGGLAFISVPNKYNPPYRIYKLLAETAGMWKVGEEYPYSRREFKHICQDIGIVDYSFFGDSLWWSFNFINPLIIVNKVMKRVFGIQLQGNLSLSGIKKEKGTVIDQYVSYALVLCGKK